MTANGLAGFRAEVRAFAQGKVRARAQAQDAAEAYDAEVAQDLAKRGWLGISAPVALGGAGQPAAWAYAVVEELGAEDITAAAIVTGQFTLVADLLAREAPALAAEWVPKVLAGEAAGCYALTEPDAGSNPAELSCQARPAEGGVALTGQKIWITNGSIADFAVIYAREGERISAFLLELAVPGVERPRMHGKLGFRASDTSELILNDVFVPDSCRINKTGHGLAVALRTLDNGRLGIAAMGAGAMRGLGERLVEAAGERPNQAAMRRVADVECALAATKALVARAVARKEAGERFTVPAAMAKWRASQGAVFAANALLSSRPEDALAASYAERMWRDVRVLELFEGTSEVQKLLIAASATGVRAFA